MFGTVGRSRFATALVALMFVLTACQQPQAQQNTSGNTQRNDEGPSGSLNVGLVSLGTENWVPRMNNPDEAPIWQAMMDSAIGTSRQDGFSLDPKEGLVESWDLKINGDKIDFTMHLRKNIPFHKGNGTVTMNDFKFTLGQYIRDGSVNPGAGEKKKVLNGSIDNFEVIDDYTAVIHTTTESARAGIEEEFSMYSGSLYGIMPKAYFEKVGGEEGYAKAPIGTGPYQFVEFKPNEYIRFEAVPNHWRHTAAYKTLTFYKIPDPSTALAQLRSGQVDIIAVSPRQLNEIKNVKDIKVHRVEKTGEVFMVFGGMVQPTRPAYDPTLPWIQGDLLSPNAVKVREALTYAVDRKAIIDRLLLGEARQTGVPYLFDQPGTGWYNPAWKPVPYDPALAKKLLAEAGYPNGFSIKAEVFPLPYFPANSDVMEAIAGYWEAVGVKVEREMIEYRPTARQRLVDRTTAGYIYVYTQPQYYTPYRYLSGSCCFRTDSALNHWEITYVDKKTDEARLAYDQKKRDAIMKEIGDFIYQNYIGIPIGATNSLWATRTDKVGEWQIAPGQSTLRDLEYVQKP